MDTAAANRVTVDRDVPYHETPDGTLHLDAYRPDDAFTAVRAVVGVSGIYDLTTADDDPDIYRQFLGGTSEEMPDRYRRASPLSVATADAPPTLLVHGTDDEAVPATQSERYRDRLADLGVEIDLLAADGGDHMVPFRNEWYDEIVERSVAFLRSNL